VKLSELPAQVLDFVAAHSVMTLATAGPDGPWAAAVFYAHDDQRLLFLSAPGTRHGRNLARDPRCAATIQADSADWPRIQGIQLEGRVAQLAAGEAAQARELYGRKFPIVGRTAQVPAAIVEAMARIRWYELMPERLFFVDNRRGFGHRDAFGDERRATGLRR